MSSRSPKLIICIEILFHSSFLYSSREELLDKVHELGLNYEKHSGSCSQSLVAAIHQLVEMDDVIVRAASSSAGGQLGQVMGRSLIIRHLCLGSFKPF